MALHTKTTLTSNVLWKLIWRIGLNSDKEMESTKAYTLNPHRLVRKTRTPQERYTPAPRNTPPKDISTEIPPKVNNNLD